MKLFILFIFCLLFANIKAQSNELINFSLEIENLQNLANQLYKENKIPHPIIIFDNDEINWKFLQADSLEFEDDSSKEIRYEIISNYVHEKIGYKITSKDVLNLDPFVTVMKESAWALPFRLNWETTKFRFCAVFPPSINSNQRYETMRLLDFQEEIYGSLKPIHYKEEMSYNELMLFSLYHEFSHCLDPVFFPKQLSYHEPDALTTHQGESFAETNALLLLAKRGFLDIGRKRLILRSTYSRMVGKYLTLHPEFAFGNPIVIKGGIIYYLTPSLSEGLFFVLSNKYKISDYTISELINYSVDIVNRSAIETRSFHALFSYLESDDKNEVISRYERLAYNDPGLFYKAYTDLIAYIAFTDLVLNQAFDIDQVESPNDIELPPLSIEDFCLAKNNNDESLMRSLLYDQRQLLVDSQYNFSSQKNRIKQLNQLHLELQLNCSN